MKIHRRSEFYISVRFRQILSILVFVFFGNSIAWGQAVHPDLGLNGTITWLSDTRIRVEYDWTDDDQLKDWIPTNGSELVRGNGTLTIRGGVASVRSMIWKQLVKCSRISAEGAKAINSSNAHLNFITNVAGWNGYNFNPPEMAGVIYIASGNIFTENSSTYNLPSPRITLGTSYNIEVNVSETAITTRASTDNIVYSHNLGSPPDPERQVAIGGWGGDTEWGKVTLEGEVNIARQTPADMIEIITAGTSFTPVIELEGNAVVEWIFDDGTTSSSPRPVKNYGSTSVRHNLLRVTPWSSVIGINLGYDAADGGYGGFDIIARQDVVSIANLSLVRNSLQYICTNYSPIAEIDLTGFSALEFIEMLTCQNLAVLKLGTHPNLERICIEDGNIKELDISGCQNLEDFRAANNMFPSINWGSVGADLWHICVRNNPQFEVNIPDMSQFPVLMELLVWDANQTGMFECHNPNMQIIEVQDNHYTGADVSGCNMLRTFSISGSRLTTLNLGSASVMTDIRLKDCGLSQSLTDYVLQTIDGAGRSNGVLDLGGNSAPSASGMVHYNNLRNRGWTVTITEPGPNIPVTSVTIAGAQGVTSINVPDGTLQLSVQVLPENATEQGITWTIADGLDVASVNADGLVTALADGTVTVRGTANDGSGVFGEITVVVSNQESSSSDGGYSPIGNIIVNSSELRILLNDDYNSWRASLYNFNGRLVSNKYVDGDILTFDISALSPGIYLIVLGKNDLILTARFYKP